MPNKAKIVNYTPEQTAEMLAAYTLQPTAETVKALSEQFGKSTRSIIAKLSREGVYKRKEYETKNGGKPEAKENIVTEIAAMLNVPAEKLGGLEKANKVALVLIREALS